MKEDIPLKTSIDVAHIRTVSRILYRFFTDLSEMMKPGNNVLHIVHKGKDVIHKSGAESALQGFKNFPAPFCISINHVAAHGIPTDYILKDGDIVSVDAAIVKDGWFSDGAWTYIVGEGDNTRKRLVKSAWQATRDGITAAKALNFIGDIGWAIQNRVRSFGLSVLTGFTGHGTGFQLHEGPTVPHVGEKGSGQPIVPGMVFTIEPIVSLGNGEVKTLHDKWTIVTSEGDLTAHFEHTIAIFSRVTEILTGGSNLYEEYPDYPPF